MNKIKSLKKISLLFLATSMFIKCTSKGKQQELSFEKIQSEFVTPANDNTLWCYWYWIGDDISKEGITKDLEAMKEAGIGGAFIGNINPNEKDGKVPILSEDWWDHMVHAVNEGKRIGVDIGSFNCPGWSQSGGPWVKPEMAMRYMTYSEALVKGGKQVNIKLPKPKEEFQDSYVLAFPSIAKEKNVLSLKNASIKTTPTITNANNLMDSDMTSSAEFKRTEINYDIEITGQKAIKANSLRIIPGKEAFIVEGTISAMIDGEYKKIKSFLFDRRKLDVNVGADVYAPLLIAIPNIESKKFKITFVKSNTGGNWSLKELVLSEASGLDNYARKTLAKMHPTPFPAWDSYLWETQNNVADNSHKLILNDVIDISNKMDAEGHLVWDAPEGDWTVQRFGMTPTGTQNSPAAPQGKGYEIDKANKELIKFHYDQFIGEFLRRIPEESKSAFKYVIADSYEMGSQNWTDGYEEKFEAKFGYNPKRYLPVFSGKIVGSVEESERFLWDLRRSVADAVAYEYVGGLKEASNEDNLQTWLENYGHWGFPSEFLMYGGQSDLIGGEFWNEGTLGDIECKSASSAAHIYGKPVVSAEAFTAAQRTYVRHPAMLKKRGDWSYTEGVNHMVLHVYIHQPDDTKVPGVNAWFSTEFNRHNTWFKKSKSYFDYLRRNQHVLQQGTYAADVCYFIGENAPIMTGARNPELPDGYSYDYINAEVILNRVSIKDGKFVLPDGMSYSLMVLPPFKTMRPELLTKIEDLVKQGGKIYGAAPEKSPSLQNYPQCDEIVKTISDKMWNSSSNKVKKYGEGFIVDGLELQVALTQLNISKDIIFDKALPVLWTHRSMPGMEIYFLTNQSDDEINLSPSFRVAGKKPQLWDAMTGTIRPLTEFTEEDGRITVPINMKGNQSWFVVFSNSDIETTTPYLKNFPEPTIVQTVEAPWTVDFKNKQIGPKEPVSFPKLTNWIAHENKAIKYYSGTASYSSTFNFKKEGNNKDIFIDLGEVGIMASVKINGIDIGTTWISPFKLNASNAIKEGKNTIVVEVVNVWRNRLTWDKTLPENEKKTWLLVDNITPEETLVTSGLLGPVTIQTLDKK